MSQADRGRVVPGIHPVRELLRSSQPVAEIHVARGRESSEALDEIRALASDRGVPVRQANRQQVDALAEGVANQGVVAFAAAFPYRGVDDLLAADHDDALLLVALDGVSDPHNLGSVARSAEAVGAHGLIVPSRRAAGVTPAGEKAAAGALAHLPVARVTNLTRTLRTLADEAVWSVGLDADAELSVDECELLTEPVVIVVGSEGRGLSRLVAETCDQRVYVPMRGRVASLNASVAAAVALYAARFRRDR